MRNKIIALVVAVVAVVTFSACDPSPYCTPNGCDHPGSTGSLG